MSSFNHLQKEGLAKNQTKWSPTSTRSETLGINFTECKPSLGFKGDRNPASHNQDTKLITFLHVLTAAAEKEKKKIRGMTLGKEPVMLTGDPNLLLIFSGQDVFLSKASGEQRSTDGWWQFSLPCLSVQNVLD